MYSLRSRDRPGCEGPRRRRQARSSEASSARAESGERQARLLRQTSPAHTLVPARTLEPAGPGLAAALLPLSSTVGIRTLETRVDSEEDAGSADSDLGRAGFFCGTMMMLVEAAAAAGPEPGSDDALSSCRAPSFGAPRGVLRGVILGVVSILRFRPWETMTGALHGLVASHLVSRGSSDVAKAAPRSKVHNLLVVIQLVDGLGQVEVLRQLGVHLVQFSGAATRSACSRCRIWGASSSTWTIRNRVS